MIEIFDEDVYTVKRIKEKLQDKYKDNIFFAEVSDRKNDVCFRNTASRIISDQLYDNMRSNADDKSKQNIETDVKLIKSDIRGNLKRSTDSFPSTDDASKVGWILDTLRHFLKKVIKSEVQSIGQCIVKGALPRSLKPSMLFALAVELDHMFGLRWLNTELLKLRFSESYSEVIRFKQTVVMTKEIGAILQSIAT